jgi:hypothetical protein
MVNNITVNFKCIRNKRKGINSNREIPRMLKYRDLDDSGLTAWILEFIRNYSLAKT